MRFRFREKPQGNRKRAIKEVSNVFFCPFLECTWVHVSTPRHVMYVYAHINTDKKNLNL